MLVYTIELDPLAAAAIAADFPHATVQALPPLDQAGTCRWEDDRPDLVILGSVASVDLARAAVLLSWDEWVVVAAIDPESPVASVWHGPGALDRVELAPGFLTPYI